jgi:hypothetical protein
MASKHVPLAVCEIIASYERTEANVDAHTGAKRLYLPVNRLLWSESAVLLVRKLWTEAWFGGNCDNYEHEPGEKDDRRAALEYTQRLLAEELKKTDARMVSEGHKFFGFDFEALATTVKPEFSRFFETAYARYRRSGDDIKLEQLASNMERILQLLPTHVH